MNPNRLPPQFKAVATQFAVNLAGVQEAFWQPFWDLQTYAAAGQTLLTFFQNPTGAGGRTYFDTNMQAAGSFPAMQNYIVTQLEIEFLPGATTAQAAYVTDQLAVQTSGYVELNIGSKNFLRDSPVGAFPPKHRLDVFAVNDASAAPTVFRYAQNRGEIANITPMLIPSLQNFNVTLNWAAAVPVSANGTIRVKMGGFLFRTAQ